MSTSNEPTPVAVLMFPKSSKALITFARAVISAMTDNANFPSPTPSLAVVAGSVAALEEAETKAATKAKGAATFRDAKKKRVKEDISHLRDYVQSIVEASPTPAAGAAVITSAFMSVRKRAKRPSPELSAKNADASGRVALAAKPVAKAATYFWQYSLDQSTWTPVPETMASRMVISGLASAQVYYFRFRAFTRAGWRDYSQTVSLLVH